MFKLHRRNRHGKRFVSMLEPMEGRQLLSIVPAVMLSPGPVSTGGSSAAILHETKGVSFTANLGSFFAAGPGTNLQALVTWGDGTSSKGTLKSTVTPAVNLVRFEVDGTHTYNAVGAFPITVIVTKSGPGPTSPVLLVTTLHDEAIVTGGNLNLTGKISGHYTAAPTSIAVGALYQLTGTGVAGEMGAVAAKGTITVPALIASSTAAGVATGTLTLSSISASPVSGGGTVTLTLTGPVQKAAGPLPLKMSYTITGGTGQFAGATGVGTIGISVSPGNAFSLTISSILPVV